MKKFFVINKQIVVCKDHFNTKILYNLENERVSRISEITLKILEFLQKPRRKEEIKKFFQKQNINLNELQILFKEGIIKYTKLRNIFYNLYEVEKIKKLSNRLKKNFPSKIGLYLTRACNLRCIHCCFAAGIPQLLELSKNDWLKIIDEATKNGFEILQISGGEPLIKREIFRAIIERSKTKFNSIGINTNATLIDEKIAKLLKGDNITVYVSIYGHTPFLYKKVTTKNLFFQAEEGIRLLIRNRVNVRASVPLINPLINHLDDIENYIKKLGIEVISFIGLIPRGRALDNFNKLTPPWIEKYVPLITKYCQKTEDMLIKDEIIRSTQRKNLNPERKTPPYSGQIIDIPCHLMNKRLFVFWDGSVYPCEFLPTYLGNLKFETIKEILSKTESRYFFKELTVENIRFCNKCAYRFYCKAICPSYANSFTGDFKNPPPTCTRAWKYFYRKS